MANVLGELFQDIADAIRSKTGSTDTLKPNQFPEAIEGITGGGGGSSADVRYVTFMNGTEVLYKKPVAVGDDCVDVLTKGLISTPTKESTAQYNYGYLGWGATDNGAADANILKNITEDKTVYAIYSAVLRFYTITWLDDDGSVLKTETLAYGATPSYTPEKDQYIFAGWTPSVSTVTGDATYTAVWEGMSVKWKLENGTLTIYGRGEMENYTGIGTSVAPWDADKATVTSIVIENGITRIGNRSFIGCSNATSMTIADSVTSIGSGAFQNCTSMENIDIPNGVTTIGRSAFYGCKATKSLTIPDSVISLGTSTFGSIDSLTSITIGSGITSLPDSVFSYCKSLTSVTIPSNVTSLKKSVFANCDKLANVEMSDNLQEIDNRVFSYCPALESITFGSGVKQLGAGLFKYSPNLSSVTFKNTSGWKVYASSTATDGTSVDVTNQTNAATLLRETYVDYFWKRT